ncbi:MAG: hypothetical protein LBF93_00360 [Zoogloeaceae bacterium]|jgi:Tfp pilus assembly protein PilE|nr:hypothetical protein [Zoogloeaceae bacterium]
MCRTSRAPGFTLIELLTVCAILVALSYLAWGAYLGVDRRVEDELARGELLRLADALRRFHDDTGYWPGEGPFQLNENCSDLSSSIAAVDSRQTGPYGDAADTESATGTFEERKEWFTSPANLSLLFRKPVICEGHRLAFLEDWNAETHRGWNGPYLPTNKLHWVDLLAGAKLVNIPAFGVGPAFAPNAGSADCTTDLNRCAFSWRSVPVSSVITLDDSNGDGVDDVTGYDPAKHEFARHARPFLFFLEPPRVVYAGEDGRYGDADPGDDPCRPTASLGDDMVICL